MSKSRILSTLVSDTGPLADGQLTAADLGALATVALSNLTDVDLTTPPTNAQALVYDVSMNKWRPGSVASGGGGGGGNTAAAVGYSLIFGG
jgi:hypothetical protein